MKINNLLEGITAASSPENATNSAPDFGRSEKFLEDEKLEETSAGATGAGSVASVSSPVGGMQRRAKGSIFSGIKTSAKFPNSQAVKEGDSFGSFAGLKDWQVWNVHVYNNYYRGKYADYGPRLYSVVASSPDEARQVVINNADYVLKDLLSRKLQSGKKVLPRGSALPVEEKRVGKAEPGSITTVGFKEMLTPEGPMNLKFNNGKIVASQDPVVQGSDLKTVAKADLGNNSLNLPAGYGDVVQPQRLEGVAEGSDDNEPFNYEEWKASTVKPRRPRGYKDAELIGQQQAEINRRRTLGLNASLDQHADDKMKELDHKFKPVDEAFIAPALSAANANAEYERQKKLGGSGGGYRGRVNLDVEGKDDYLAVKNALTQAAKKIGHHVECGLSGNKMSVFSDSMNSDQLDYFVDSILPQMMEEGYGDDDDYSDFDYRDEIAQLENQIKYTKSEALRHTLYQQLENMKRKYGVEDEEEYYGDFDDEGNRIDEKSKSQAQFRTMAAVAHNPKFAKKVGISQKVGKEFHRADKKQDYKDLPKEVDEEKQRLDPKCWTGYKKQGTKMKGGVRVNNCVKVDEAEFTEDKLAQDLYKDLQIFKKGADKDIGSKAKDKEIGNKPKDKDIVAKEDWQKTNKQDKTDGMSPKAVKAYRRENPGSKLQTAVTKKPSELKAGSKDAKRRKSFCARMSGNKGPMKDENGKPTPKAKALKRWNCE